MKLCLYLAEANKREIAKAVKKIQKVGVLTPDLLKKEYRNCGNRFYGHCYVATEALWHMMGGKESGLHPTHGKDHKGVIHWWLEDDQLKIYDVTAKQYTDEGLIPPYNKRKRSGFLTKEPSKRAREVIRRVGG